MGGEGQLVMEQLKTIDASTPPGTRVLVVGPGGWEIYAGELVKSGGVLAAIRGRDGQEHECFAYAVHVYPEAAA